MRTLAPLALVLLASSVASAQPRRVVGAGVSLGLGLSAHGNAPALVQPQFDTDVVVLSEAPLELVVPVDESFGIDVSLPIPAMVQAAFFDTLALGTEVYLEWGFGDDVRFLVGPGVGVALFDFFDDHLATGSIAGSVTARALLGIELLFAQRRLGLRFVTRPWLGVTAGAQDLGPCILAGLSPRTGECFSSGTQLVGGAMIEVVLVGYATRE